MMFFYYATGINPAMAKSTPGTGSAYAITVRDVTGNYLDGSRTYKVTLPGPIPAKNFWSFTVYDNQTRSLLPTDQKLAGLDSTLSFLTLSSQNSHCQFSLRRPKSSRVPHSPILSARRPDRRIRATQPLLSPECHAKWCSGRVHVNQRAHEIVNYV